jgi:hypothetical protein
MSEATLSPLSGGSAGSTAPAGEQGTAATSNRPGPEQVSPPSSSATRIAPRRPTPLRLVVSLALLLFLPNLWMVMNGNVTVQTSLVRFIGALMVSWIAARLVFATLNSFPRPGTSAEATSSGRVGAMGLGPADS